MFSLPNGCHVLDPRDGVVSTHGPTTTRLTIGRHLRARDIAQTVTLLEAGRSPSHANPGGEEVCYVVDGRGTCWLGDARIDVEAGSFVYVPPGEWIAFETPGPSPLHVVSVCCPEPADVLRRDAAPATLVPTGTARHPDLAGCAGHRRDRRVQEMGVRRFSVLADGDVGCQRVTQFIGVVPPSEAPPHHHTYEEAIFILEGRGRFWVDGSEAPFSPGSCIYLPRLVPHSLRNDGPDDVVLLGVFHPSGSPAVNYPSPSRS